VNLEASTFRNDNSAQPGTRATGSQIVAALSVPIYQGGQEHARVRQAKQQAQQAREVLADARRAAVENARRAWETLTASRAQITALRAQVRANEIALDGVQREALVGSRTTLDVLNAEQELLDARVALVRATRDVVIASYALAATAGRLTARDLNLPVPIYDPIDHYGSVRNRLFGTDIPAPR
jgi:outer membrane protein